MAARATFDLNTGVWFRRGRLLIVSPVRGHHRRYQAETPLIPLSRFAEPALAPSSTISSSLYTPGGTPTSFDVAVCPNYTLYGNHR
jgi:hypothetical protein